jgi:hypothetical protein
MRIKCDRCGGKARIKTTREVTTSFRHLYCSCTNAECGHTFVMDLSFSHTLSPSALDLSEATRAALRVCATQAQAQAQAQGVLGGVAARP